MVFDGEDGTAEGHDMRLDDDVEEISLDHLRWYRIANSGLVTPFPSANECAKRLIGVQAQMPTAAALALGVRLRDLTFERYNEMVHSERSLVRTWGQRSTLHVYDAEDWCTLIPAFRGRRSWAYRRFVRSGGTGSEFDSLMGRIDDALRGSDGMTRDELEERVGLDLGPWGGMLIDAAHRGLVVDPGNGTLSHGDLWTGGCRPCIEGDAMTTLVERYLRAYGPATSRDVAHWGGIGVREADRHLEALDTRSISCRGGMMHLMEDDIDRLLGTGPPKRGWPSILLYRFDPLLLAYRDKSWIVPEGLQRRVWTSGGHVSGVVLEKGSAAGVWSYGRRGAGYAVRADLFGRCLKRTERAIASFERYLDLFFDARRR